MLHHISLPPPAPSLPPPCPLPPTLCPPEKMLQMGFTLKEIQESLSENRYDEVCATYMLLAREVDKVVVRESFDSVILLQASAD